MQELLDRFLAAMAGAGIRAMTALPSKLTPMLKAPITAVGVASAAHAQAGLGQYLGSQADLQRGDCPVYGQFLEAAVFFQVASPVQLGGGRCFQEGMAVMDLLLAGIDSVQILACEMGRCRYDAKADYFTCEVTAKLRAAVYLKTADEAAAVAEFDLRGEIL